MSSTFKNKNDEPRVACHVEVEIPDKLTYGVDPLLERAGRAVKGPVQPVAEIDAVRFRIYPDRIQQQVLKRWIGAQRYIYNQKVEELSYQLWLKNNAKFSNRFQEPQENTCPWDQAFSKYTLSAPWLEEIPSFIRRNGCSRFGSAMGKWAKGGGRPQHKTRKSVQSVLLTAECFTLQICDGEDRLFIGTRSRNFGVLKWAPHCEYKEPRQISITHEPDGKWFVGFSFQSGRILRGTSIPESKEEVLGLDRGIVNPVTDSTGRFYDFTPAEKVKLRRRAKKRTRLQQRLARQKRRSRRGAKTGRSIAVAHARDRRLRASVAHRIANHVVNHAIETGCKAIGVEDLRLGNMTRACKAKQGDDGSYLPNGQAAKSGLNRSLLCRSLGQINTFVEYRCRRIGLLKITEISPGTSLKNARLSTARKGQPVELV
jgi:putative transposase